MEGYSIDLDTASGHPADPFELSRGQVVADRFRIERCINAGGVGTVYEATQIGLKRRVAIKILTSEAANTPSTAERFGREAFVMAGLRHPNIVTVHDFGVLDEHRAFIAMEFLSGPTLARWIATAERRSVRDIVARLLPVCRALAALHRAGILHCDVKPANIIVPPIGESAEVTKLVDFGLVRLGAIDALGTDETLCGTLEYMAPELFDGSGPTPSSDLYALAATAYEAFCGVLPFAGDSLLQMQREKLSGPPTDLSRRRADIPLDVERVILAALHPDMSRRPASVDAFVEALEQCLELEDRVEAERTAPPARAKSILLVEDDPSVQKLFARTLVADGYDVITAGDGIDALLSLGAGRFDLVVSDINMPNLDGVALLRMMVEKGIRTPVVFLSAAPDARDRLPQLGFDSVECLCKPIGMRALLEAVRRNIRARDALAQPHDT